MRLRSAGERSKPARRRLLEQRHAPWPLGDPAGELVDEHPVDLHVGLVSLAHAQQARAPRAQRRIGREVPPVEEVPAKDREYDALLTRHFLTGEELTGEELRSLIERALELKADRLASRAIEGSSVALLFERPSTRTRVSFEVGIHELGGHPVVLREGELQLTRGESVRDTALVLSRYVAAIGLRTGPHEIVEELARHATVPVFNMLTHEHHPCQVLADLMTMRERFGELQGVKLAYVGDGNN